MVLHLLNRLPMLALCGHSLKIKESVNMGKIHRAMKNGRKCSDYSENFVTFVSSRESHEGHRPIPDPRSGASACLGYSFNIS